MFVPILAGSVWVLIFGSVCVAVYQGVSPLALVHGFIVANLALSVVFLCGSIFNISRIGRRGS